MKGHYTPRWMQRVWPVLIIPVAIIGLWGIVKIWKENK